MALPPLTEGGELPQGVHLASLREVLERFGVGLTQRKAVALRLERIYRAARASGHLARFVVFGSFVTDKPEPNDVDVFLLMEDTFDASKLEGETLLLFDHAAAQAQRVLAATSGGMGRRGHSDRILAGQARRRPEGHHRDHPGGTMIASDQELDATLERIRRLQAQVVYLRKMETNPVNYRLSVSGFLAEIDRMQLEVREYLSLHPAERTAST